MNTMPTEGAKQTTSTDLARPHQNPTWYRSGGSGAEVRQWGVYRSWWWRGAQVLEKLRAGTTADGFCVVNGFQADLEDLGNRGKSSKERKKSSNAVANGKGEVLPNRSATGIRIFRAEVSRFWLDRVTEMASRQ